MWITKNNKQIRGDKKVSKREIKEVEEKSPERFVIDIPDAMWKRIEKHIKGNFLNKTSFTKQAFDHFLTCDKGCSGI